LVQRGLFFLNIRLNKTIAWKLHVKKSMPKMAY
jgi:hypothetical protein